MVVKRGAKNKVRMTTMPQSSYVAHARTCHALRCARATVQTSSSTNVVTAARSPSTSVLVRHISATRATRTSSASRRFRELICLTAPPVRRRDSLTIAPSVLCTWSIRRLEKSLLLAAVSVVTRTLSRRTAHASDSFIALDNSKNDTPTYLLNANTSSTIDVSYLSILQYLAN